MNQYNTEIQISLSLYNDYTFQTDMSDKSKFQVYMNCEHIPGTVNTFKGDILKRNDTQII